ncbi:hypothetical protein ACFPRL_16480 [Pseudoclavibacter helvolus]
MHVCRATIPAARRSAEDSCGTSSSSAPAPLATRLRSTRRVPA